MRAHAIVTRLVDSNPITVQALGLCSALAVTTSLLPSLIMGAAVTGVLTFSSALVSSLRAQIPSNVRLVLQITIVASGVIVADEILKAFAPDVSRVLSVFVGLIVTNCIVLSRTDVYAMQHRVWPSFLDGLSNGLGYASVLAFVGALRELFGAGSLLGYRVLPVAADGGWYEPNRLMQLAPSAFFIIALVIWWTRWRRSEDDARERVAPAISEAEP